MRDAVALVLADVDVARQLALVGPLLHHLLEQARRADDVRPGLLEEVENSRSFGANSLESCTMAGESSL